MSGATKIEWTDATWNPVTGCTKVSAGCKFCYAERDFHRPYPGRAFTDVRTHPERLDWPLRWRGSKQAKAEGRPSRIFVNSMSDLFHEDVPDDFLTAVFATMGMAERQVFQVLTKRGQRAAAYLKSRTIFGKRRTLPNVWLGVSVEDQQTADERIPILLQTPAAVRWVSYEPALGPVDFKNFTPGRISPGWTGRADEPCQADWGLDWIVAGGESGPRARPPHPDWFRKVRDDCQAAGVPFFFKQWGAWRPCEHGENPHAAVNPNGDQVVPLPSEFGPFPPRDRMRFVGKKKAGCLLDGREHKEFPQMQEVGNRK